MGLREGINIKESSSFTPAKSPLKTKRVNLGTSVKM